MTEMALYDGNGEAVAYFADDGTSIYTWDGDAVAYVYEGKLVYGWNGDHLGWLERGIFYDTGGDQVGYTAATCPSIIRILPIKSFKSIPSVKGIRCIPSVRPVLLMGRSNRSFVRFLEQGA